MTLPGIRAREYFAVISGIPLEGGKSFAYFMQ
jgi:hypothetical protein